MEPLTGKVHATLSAFKLAAHYELSLFIFGGDYNLIVEAPDKPLLQYPRVPLLPLCLLFFLYALLCAGIFVLFPKTLTTLPTTLLVGHPIVSRTGLYISSLSVWIFSSSIAAFQLKLKRNRIVLWAEQQFILVPFQTFFTLWITKSISSSPNFSCTPPKPYPTPYPTQSSRVFALQGGSNWQILSGKSSTHLVENLKTNKLMGVARSCCWQV